eukprot:Nitzschia sp. Nitz4//scaffold60_size111251//103745//104617//NITZ4_004165-RA/size111251-processed-gene-0.45-mRNA-1//-1//CDS//3329555618//2041//frame0
MQMDDNTNKSTTLILPNNAVAQSDYDAAMRAIQSTFQEEASHPFLQQAQSALLDHLQRIVVPVKDQEFEEYVDLYHQPMEEDEDDDDASDPTRSMPPLEQVFQKLLQQELAALPPINEEDLLDAKAQQEAKELRSSLCSLSQQIEQVRGRVLEASSQQAVDPRVQHMLEQQNQLPIIQSPSSKPSNPAASVEELQTSLEALAALLQQSTWTEELPQQLQSLQQTMDVIQKDSSEDRVLSQTEMAIVSRTNTMDDEDLDARRQQLIKGEGGQDQPLSPADRLADFLEQYQY